MPKRKSERSEEERLKNKIKKYEAKLKKKYTRIVYSSDEISEPDDPPPLQNVQAPSSVEHEGVFEETESTNQPAAQTPEAAAVPSTSATEPSTEIVSTPNPESDLVDPALLLALGDFIPEIAEWGDDINGNLAKILEPILKDGLKKELKEDILKKYLLPKNCPLSKSPILNPEISAVLSENAKNRDLRIIKKQNQLGCGLAIVGKIITGMLTKSLDTPGALKLLSDLSKMLADSHFTETETRRALITPILEKSFVEPFKDRKRDSHLFGDKLGEFIKSSRGIKKTGQLIQGASVPSSNLNWRGPPPRQFQRSSRWTLNRAGGPRAQPPPQAPTRQQRQTSAPAARRPAPPTAPPGPARRAFTAPTTRRR